MANRQTRVPDRVLITSLLLAGLIVLFAPRNLTSKFQFAFVRVFCWPLGVAGDISLSASDLVASAQGSPEDVISREKYDTLHNRLANVTEWLRQERDKVERLSGLRNRPVWKGVDFVLADVIVASTDASHSELIINRGQEDGLALGQVVLSVRQSLHKQRRPGGSDESVIGTICALGGRTAHVRLITDPASKIAVKIEGSNSDRIMQGDGRHCAKVLLVPTSQRIETGAVVYAQKKPGFLGTPVIVGAISECAGNSEDPLLWDITVTPACDLERLTNVAVVVMNPRR